VKHSNGNLGVGVLYAGSLAVIKPVNCEYSSRRRRQNESLGSETVKYDHEYTGLGPENDCGGEGLQ
jgi:hypothetical protein